MNAEVMEPKTVADKAKLAAELLDKRRFYRENFLDALIRTLMPRIASEILHHQVASEVVESVGGKVAKSVSACLNGVMDELEQEVRIHLFDIRNELCDDPVPLIQARMRQLCLDDLDFIKIADLDDADPAANEHVDSTADREEYGPVVGHKPERYAWIKYPGLGTVAVGNVYTWTGEDNIHDITVIELEKFGIFFSQDDGNLKGVISPHDLLGSDSSWVLKSRIKGGSVPETDQDDGNGDKTAVNEHVDNELRDVPKAGDIYEHVKDDGSILRLQVNSVDAEGVHCYFNGNENDYRVYDIDNFGEGKFWQKERLPQPEQPASEPKPADEDYSNVTSIKGEPVSLAAEVETAIADITAALETTDDNPVVSIFDGLIDWNQNQGVNPDDGDLKVIVRQENGTIEIGPITDFVWEHADYDDGIADYAYVSELHDDLYVNTGQRPFDGSKLVMALFSDGTATESLAMSLDFELTNEKRVVLAIESSKIDMKPPLENTGATETVG